MKTSDEDKKRHISSLIPYMSNFNTKEWNTILCNYNEREQNYKNNRDTVYFFDIIAGCLDRNEVIAQDNKRRVNAFNKIIDHICSSKFYNRNKKDINTKIKNALGLAKSEIIKGNFLFKNWLNELLFMDALLWSNDIREIKVDHKLSNGKDIDFVIIDNQTGERIGFEIKTEQHFDPEKSNTVEKVNQYLTSKAQEKLEYKTHGISEIQDLDQLYIVLFIEINPNMAETIFPKPGEMYDWIILRSSVFLKLEEDNSFHYFIDDPTSIIERLKKDDSTFFR